MSDRLESPSDPSRVAAIAEDALWLELRGGSVRVCSHNRKEKFLRLCASMRRGCVPTGTMLLDRSLYRSIQDAAKA